jgi:ATP-dependent RNA helicase RhlE
MTFEDLNLGKSLNNAISDLGITHPTTIQEKTFSKIMAGNDVIGIAQTGTGKTFAFLLPALRLWKFSKNVYPQILIIVPTRELVAQIVEEVEKLTTYMTFTTVGVYGGTNIKTHKHAISLGCDLVVGTPGRLNDLLLDGVLKAKDIKRLIIDEVDEMLNLGFRVQLQSIREFLPAKRQNLMFSATMIPEVETVIKEYTEFYEKIEVAPSGAPLEIIDQSVYHIPNFNSKANLLIHLLKNDEMMKKVLVFVSTKKMADVLYDRLYPIFEETIGVIHSSKSQNNRFQTVELFQSGSYKCIVATDLIARGLDVSQVTHVINFDLTDTPEKYIHRIGRTGRAEQRGVSLAFVTEEEQEYLQSIETLMGKSLDVNTFPEEVELSDELIDLEKPVEFVPFNNHKTKRFVPSGPAFHEKKEKNKKENRHQTRAEKLKEKYKKPKKRRPKK